MTLPRFRSARPACTRASVPAKSSVVCSPLESRAIHEACGRGFVTVAPGIRFADAGTDDQVRITTPARAREIGSSKWTLRKKLRLVADTLFSFSTLPITIVTWLGGLSCVGSVIWALDALISKLSGRIDVTGWTMMFIFQLLSFGIIMLTLGLLGAYLWRTFDAARRRPPYLIERSDGEAPLDRRARR